MSGCVRLAYGLAARLRQLVIAGVALCVVASACALQAAEPNGASTSAEARNEARRAVPLAKIGPQHRGKVREVINDPSLFRRLPTNVVDCQPELFTYFTENPEALVEIWRHLGVSRVQLTRTGANTFDISDGAGTTGKLTVVEQTCDASAQNRIVMYAEGSFTGKPFNRPISAECVLLLRSGSMEETNGRRYVAARLDSFIKLDRMSLELVAKAVHPFVGQTADRNFADTLSFVSNLSYTAEKRPEAIEQLAEEVESLDAGRREALVAVAHRCAQAGRVWQASRAEQSTVELK